MGLCCIYQQANGATKLENKMSNLAHLIALQTRLSNEKQHIVSAATKAEKELRTVWIAQIEKEIQGEEDFLGLPEFLEFDDLTDDELLAELFD